MMMLSKQLIQQIYSDLSDQKNNLEFLKNLLTTTL